ncbi:hypothetical protein FQA39_LY17800 [Lamprigera yunnana]|nr:hypothetical protein FQA39_LY17800 [Lamprigera yunnana]
MNLFIPESVLGMQRCRHWMPLFTQQLRLRHLYQIMVYNVTSGGSGSSYYYTLHLTTMCAPFYTSEKSESLNPKWKELDPESFVYSSISAFVIRIWKTQENDVDVVILTWCINLSGLTYLGVKLSEIQPDSFRKNSVILHLRGGYFTSSVTLCNDLPKPLPFINRLNISSDGSDTKVFRHTKTKTFKNEVKHSYSVQKLQKVHSLQLNIKNQSLDVQKLRDDIVSKCGLCNGNGIKQATQVPRRKHSSQLLTMMSLNKMLQLEEKPTIEQRQQIINICKQVEIAKFRTKLLSHEKDRQSAYLRQLKRNHSMLVEENEEKGYLLMENYRILRRDSDKLKEWSSKQIQLKEIFLQTQAQLQHRRQQLMKQLLFMYPIEQLSPRKYNIGGIYLPDSDMLNDSADGSISIALGYTSHILLMCSLFLQVPLRYNISFFGSRSYITDHINTALLDRDRDFPLYTKGKDKMQFNYAVYLLNKDIGQLRWMCGQHTPDLRATLSNLHSLLQGRETKDVPTTLAINKIKNLSISSSSINKSADFISQFEKPFIGSSSNICDPILDTLRQENQERCMSPINRKKKTDGPRPGLSEILAIPEAFLTQQISSNAFKTYATTEKFKELGLEGRETETSSKTNSEASCSKPPSTSNNEVELIENIEEGTDILHSSLNISDVDSLVDVSVKALIIEEHPRRESSDKLLKQNRRISRSVGSITEEEDFTFHCSLELGSDPLLNVSSDTNKSFSSGPLAGRLDEGQQEFLQKWLQSGPALVCSEENLYPEEILGNTVTISTSDSSPLTLRTDALLNTTSFNLIKPK